MPPPKCITFTSELASLTKAKQAKDWAIQRLDPMHGRLFSGLCALNLRCQVQAGAPPPKCGIQEIRPTTIKLGVAARAVDEASNKACKELLADLLRVPKTDIYIHQGLHSKIKIFKVEGKSGAFWGGVEGVKKKLLGQEQ